jgi:pimeloyl-ACP methyl ester carboxylesterase
MGTNTSNNPKTAKFYQKVPDELLQPLLDFRERYPYQTMEIQGLEWRYIDSREGEKTLLIPAGGTSVAEVSFMSLSHFAERYRVISPDYPPIDNLKDLFAGFIELLDRLGVGQFVTMGGSYGGWMVQSLVRAYPERIEKLVITAVGPPNPENSRQLAKLMPWLRLMPMFVLRALINRSFSRLDTTGDNPELALMWALVQESMQRVGREDFLALMQRLIDQTDNYSFSADDLEDWPGSILMVFGSEDPSSTPEKIEAMRALYPQAQVKVFEGGQHGIALTHQEEYFGVIDEFLAG